MEHHHASNVNKKLWNITMLLMGPGKSTISTGPFSIANGLFTRGYILPLFTITNHYQPLSTIINHYQPLLTMINHDLPLNLT